MSVSMTAGFEYFDLMDFRKKSWLSCLSAVISKALRVLQGWGTDRPWLPRLLSPGPLGGATCTEGTCEVQLLELHELLWNTHFPMSITHLQPCSCWLFLLSPVILTYQWSNLLFLLCLCNMCLDDSQHFKLTFQVCKLL